MSCLLSYRLSLFFLALTKVTFRRYEFNIAWCGFLYKYILQRHIQNPVKHLRWNFQQEYLKELNIFAKKFEKVLNTPLLSPCLYMLQLNISWSIVVSRCLMFQRVWISAKFLFYDILQFVVKALAFHTWYEFSKLTCLDQWRRSAVFVASFEHISHLF